MIDNEFELIKEAPQRFVKVVNSGCDVRGFSYDILKAPHFILPTEMNVFERIKGDVPVTKSDMYTVLVKLRRLKITVLRKSTSYEYYGYHTEIQQ